MDEIENREAWVKIPSPTERAANPSKPNTYNFGFSTAMGGLLLTHPEIGPAFMALYQQVMFAPVRALSRAEREFTASVAAAAQDCFY
jgi:hypothetical protein